MFAMKAWPHGRLSEAGWQDSCLPSCFSTFSFLISCPMCCSPSTCYIPALLPTQQDSRLHQKPCLDSPKSPFYSRLDCAPQETVEERGGSEIEFKGRLLFFPSLWYILTSSPGLADKPQQGDFEVALQYSSGLLFTFHTTELTRVLQPCLLCSLY